MFLINSPEERDKTLAAGALASNQTNGWTLLTAGDLGLGSYLASTTYFPNSHNPNAGVRVYQNDNDPTSFALVFTPLPFSEVIDVFGEYLPTPPSLNTDYADDFADIYAAVGGQAGAGGSVVATGFSLGGVAVNQLSQRANGEFAGAELTFVAFGSEYIATEARLTNIGAANDWFFGAYNAYNQHYQGGDPGLGVIATFAETVFADDVAVDATDPASFLRDFFAHDRNGAGFDGTFGWYFEYGTGGGDHFTRPSYGTAHNAAHMTAAFERLAFSVFSGGINRDDTVFFDFTAGTAFVNASAALASRSTVPAIVYVFGADGIDNRIFGTGFDDAMAGLGGNDVLFGEAGSDLIDGGDGNDVLGGGGDADVLFGDDGNDTLDGGSGQDVLMGGDGNDTYVLGAEGSGTDSVDDDSGIDTITSTIDRSLAFADFSEIENLTLLGSARFGTGNGLANIITGNTSANVLNGRLGRDVLRGGLGNDTYVLGAERSGTDAVQDSRGIDTITSTITRRLDFVDFSEIENLTLLGRTNIAGTGNRLANTITGNAGRNTLDGGIGNDRLDGGIGNDVLIGGVGRDTLTGGIGNDIFRFTNKTHSRGSAMDIITDFDDRGRGNDRIDVSRLFGPKMAYIHDAAFTASGQVRIKDIAGPDVIVEVNTGRSLAADFSIRLKGTTLGEMSASDFVL